MNDVVKETKSMITRDGVKLVSDIYYPQNQDNLPVLLMRQPYGMAIASTVVYAHPRWYAQQGYMVVIQDVRGRGDSEGEFQLFQSEIEDGYDTLEWVTNLPRSNGKVGMYGFSYQGITQLYAVISQHSALKTICPAMIAYDLYSDWAYENGAFCLQLNLSWAIQLATETARLKQDLSAYKILYLASHNLPCYDIPYSLEEVLRKYCPSNFYYQWLSHSENDSYWRQLSPKTHWKNFDLPMLHIGGWFDAYLRGTLNFYEEISQKSQFLHALIIPPWPHLPWGNTLCDRTYTQQANNQIDLYQIAWFDKYLKGIDNDKFIDKKINLFQMGSNKYLKFDAKPILQQHKLYINSTGLANIKDDDGKILLVNQSKNKPIEDIIVQDFWRPVPSFGGHNSYPCGSVNRGELDNRSDIITYTSPWLTEDLEILGETELNIFAESEQPSFDLCGILSQVFPDGKVYNFSQGYIRVKNHQQNQPINFKLQSTCIKLEKNTALRLSISCTCFPAYNLNFGDGNNHQSNISLDTKPLTITIFSGREKPSHLILKTTSNVSNFLG